MGDAAAEVTRGRQQYDAPGSLASETLGTPSYIINEPSTDETSQAEEMGPTPIYPATVAQAETFCLADTGVEFPQQIFMDDGTSIINCAQLFAEKSKAKPTPAPTTKPTTSPTLVSQKK